MPARLVQQGTRTEQRTPPDKWTLYIPYDWPCDKRPEEQGVHKPIAAKQLLMPIHLKDNALGEVQELMWRIKMRHILLPSILVAIEMEMEAYVVQQQEQQTPLHIRPIDAPHLII